MLTSYLDIYQALVDDTQDEVVLLFSLLQILGKAWKLYIGVI